VVLACRLLFLLAALDPAEERVMATLDLAGVPWPGGPERSLYDQEELYAGAAAEAIRMGAGLPLKAYRVAPYGSGSLLIPLLAVPLFALFGPYYLIFKIIPLLVTVLGGLAWFLVVRAWWGRRVAAAFGLLYLLAPSMFVRTALIAKGDHAEAMAWIGCVLLLATRAAACSDPRTQRLWAAATGIGLGLAPFITYSTVPVPAAIGLFLLLRTRARPRPVWIAVAAGFAIGAIPWVASIIATRGTILRVYGRPISNFLSGPEMLERVRHLITRGLMAGYDLPAGSALRGAAGIVWLAVVALSVGILVRRRSSPAGLCAVTGIAGGLLAFCAASPDPSSRYLVPVYPLLLLSIAAAFTPSERPIARPRNGLSHLAAVPLLAVIVMGLGAQAWVCARSTFPATRSPLKGTCWRIFGEYVGQLAGAEWIQKAPADLRPVLWIGCGKRAYWQVDRADWHAVADLAGPDSLRVWQGIGVAWVEGGRVTEAGAYLPLLDGPARSAVRVGIAARCQLPFSQLLIHAPARIPRFLQAFQVEDRALLEKILGRTLAVLQSQSVLQRGERTGPAVVPDRKTRLTGLGWALYREVDHRGRIRTWEIPADVDPDLPVSTDVRRVPEFADGLADAVCWDLSTRSRDWIAGHDAGLGAWLRRLTEGLTADQSAPFYRAAGRAMAESVVEPGAPRGAVPESLELLESVAEPCRAAFQAGWQQGLAELPER
jgi:hypothetical protein